MKEMKLKYLDVNGSIKEGILTYKEYYNFKNYKQTKQTNQ